jgi:hypothetical protein
LVRATLRARWIALCVLVCAGIFGLLAGLKTSNVYWGIAAGIADAVLGWFIGRHASPLDVFFPP